MTPPPILYHELLRPCILQILRATGFHSTRPAVLDSLTDLAAGYLSLLCQRTALHAALGDAGEDGGLDPSVVDVRLALQDVGALNPEKTMAEQLFTGVEDTRGVDSFVEWFAGKQNKAIMDMMAAAMDGGEDGTTDYLNGNPICLSPSISPTG